jgi:hypothetical protein
VDGIESAIRNALARGDMGDRSFRERVYRSVFAALERKIAEASGLSADDAQRRREALKQRIVNIEREFAVRAAERAAPDMGAPAAAPQNPAAGPAAEAPSLGPADRGDPAGTAPSIDIGAAAPRAGLEDRDAALAVRPSREAPAGGYSLPGVSGDLPENAVDEAAEERRRPWGILLIVVSVLAMLVIGGLWAWQAGLFDPDDGSVPNPPVELEDEEFAPDAPPPLSQDEAAERAWVTAFSAAEPVGFTPLAGASAELMEEDEGVKFLRLRSSTDSAAVAFAVNRDALAAMAGGPVVFDIVARAQEGQETQISVSCDFGTLGDCGRRRYVVGLHRADFLFEVDLPAGTPSGDGSVSIVTDVDGAGKAIDLFEIRLAPAQ